MQQQQIARASQKLKSVIAPEVLRQLGAESGLVQRARSITAERLVSSLLRSLGSRKVSALAELLRDFNADHSLAIFYKPFYERLDSEGFPKLMRAVFDKMLRAFTAAAVEPIKDSPLRSFADILIQDGTSFALHDALAGEYPGRFTKVSPAAVEMHCTLSLLRGQLTTATLTPDSECERHYLPDAATLKNTLLLADRGYDGTEYMAEVEAAGGSYLIRARKSHDPRVVTIYARGRRYRQLEGRKLSEVLRKAPRSEKMDMDVCWEKNGEIERPSRLVACYNSANSQWVRLMTNLLREDFSTDDILVAYRLRWQIELLFKELKSHANLHRFVTRKATIAEGLIWASLSAAVLKRFLANSCQAAVGLAAISTRRASMCGDVILGALMASVRNNMRFLGAALVKIFGYLAHNARRANPARDKATGRLQLGLQPVAVRP